MGAFDHSRAEAAAAQLGVAAESEAVLLALSVGKLLVVDMQEVDTLWRAGLFFVVGLGLMRLGFLLPRVIGAAPAPVSPAPE